MRNNRRAVTTGMNSPTKNHKNLTEMIATKMPAKADVDLTLTNPSRCKVFLKRDPVIDGCGVPQTPQYPLLKPVAWPNKFFVADRFTYTAPSFVQGKYNAIR